MVAGAFSELEIDRAGQDRGLWARRAVIALFCVIAVLALTDRFGQRASESQAASPAARMTLAPETVRGGLFFQSRVEIRALRAIAAPRLVLDHGWVEGMQVNSIEPAPASEASRDGRARAQLRRARRPATVLRVWLQFEVDPTNVGRRPYGIELDDEHAPLARVARTITVLP